MACPLAERPLAWRAEALPNDKFTNLLAMYVSVPEFFSDFALVDFSAAF
jgi:hypothetical protein